tara:strand:- start:404 stop:661 length:258 start_codon:yes stop_codon:yes gene_type:complete
MSDNKKFKSLVGRVVSSSGNKTVKVLISSRVQHPLYKKIINASKSYLVHDETGVAVGDTVEIAITRKLSKHKNWRVSKVLSKAEG